MANKLDAIKFTKKTASHENSVEVLLRHGLKMLPFKKYFIQQHCYKIIETRRKGRLGALSATPWAQVIQHIFGTTGIYKEPGTYQRPIRKLSMTYLGPIHDQSGANLGLIPEQSQTNPGPILDQSQTNLGPIQDRSRTYPRPIHDQSLTNPGLIPDQSQTNL